jgi:hypothetical protein
MRRRGFDEEAIYQALIVQDRAKCNPPIGDDRELRLIAKSACRYEPETSDLGPGEIGITTDIQPGNPFERSLLNFQGILDADVGRVDYVIDPLFPKGNLTLIAAEWKTGKTIILYRLCLDLIFGKPGLGVLPIPHPHRVGIFQLEMPSTEDLRRFRKLALGMGLDPARVLALAEAGNLSHYSLPLVSLREERGRHWFHKTILDKGIDVVVVDSLIAGFAPADLNENSIVRALIHETFSPLLKEGITCVGLHHFRKPQATDKLMGNKTQALKSAVLGGIQFGAAAGRTYGLERLGRSPIDDEGTAVDFTCRLTSLGSWTPTNVEMILSIEETDNGGTSVAILEEGDQIRHGGVTTIQQAALALSRFVKEKGRVSRQDALVHVQNECNVSERTAERGEAEAKARDWVAVAENADDKKKRDLVPGLMA